MRVFGGTGEPREPVVGQRARSTGERCYAVEGKEPRPPFPSFLFTDKKAQYKEIGLSDETLQLPFRRAPDPILIKTENPIS